MMSDLACLPQLTADADRSVRLRAACHARLSAKGRRPRAPASPDRPAALVSAAVFAFCAVYIASLIDTALRVLF
jgi:hypothetical protein